MSFKILIFCLFSLIYASSSANEQPDTSQSWIRKHFMALNSKIDWLNEEMEQIKANRSTGNDANCVESSINSTLIVVNAVQQLFQTQFNKFDEKFENDIRKIETMEVKLEKIDKKLENFEKLETKLENIEEILGQLVNKSQDVKGEVMTSGAKGQLDQQKAINACDPNPCVKGGSCVPDSHGKDFRCEECPKFRSGVHCETVKCEVDDKCWVYRNTLYVVLEPKSTWTEAERKCQSKGMRLIMPKEKDQTEFIVKQLTAVYGSGIIFFWMGLTKAEGGSGWTWSDGSELGSYTGGTSNFKRASDNKYGHLRLGNGDSMWDWDTNTYSNVYPLCEKSV